MAPRRVRVNKFDRKKLSGNDVICPICRSILIKPITLPCSHGFCSSCFETTPQNANVVCPMCRVRVGSWLRSATKSKKLINETLWQTIQNLFPLQVKNKLNKVGQDKYNGKDKNSESKSQPSKIVAKTTEQSLKCSNLMNNFATKEYTCRILCQDGPKETQKTQIKESLILKKNKRIQEITNSVSNDRSNSIESECLYFKPIDHRHNPPSKGLPPIKVPTRKPNLSPHMKILAPSGQNQINMNHQVSAFARLCSAETSKKENIQVQEEENGSKSLKRNHKRLYNKGTKKIKSSHVCDTQSEISSPVKKTSSNRLISESIKKALQVQADFELATKLQQSYNQLSYSTRSSVLKRMANENPVGLKVK